MKLYCITSTSQGLSCARFTAVLGSVVEMLSFIRNDIQFVTFVAGVRVIRYMLNHVT